jgi:putative addiction module CopG family antidote
MPIQLTPDQAQFIQTQITNGRYNTIEEVLTAALQSLATEQDSNPMDELTRAEDLRRLQNYRETGQGMPHEQVANWLSSIGADRELPCPSGN